MAQARGRLITFEGGDGAGKSTLMGLLGDRLRAQGHRVVMTREPGGTPLGEQVRGLLLSGAPGSMDAWTELFLYEASRSHHVQTVVRPALDRGEWVLCDRFADSSVAYQAGARGLPLARVQLLNSIATRGLKPDLTVLLDVAPETGLARATEQTRFEAEGRAFQSKVRKAFLSLARREGRRFLVLKAFSNEPEALLAPILTRVARLGRERSR